MTPTETITILRQFNEWRLGNEDLPQPDPKQITAAIYTAVEMIERLEKMEAALRDHHKNAMCEGWDHSHPITQLRLSAYQQSKLYADTVSVLGKSK